MKLRPVHTIAFALAFAGLILTDGAAGQTLEKAEPQGFIQFPKIPGTSSAPQRKEWIDLLSFTHVAASRADTSARRPITIQKRVDKASPLLMRAFKQGTRFPTVRLDLRDKGDARQEAYLQIKLENTMISSYSVSGQVEQLTLTYEKIDRVDRPRQKIDRSGQRAPVGGPAR